MPCDTPAHSVNPTVGAGFTVDVSYILVSAHILPTVLTIITLKCKGMATNSCPLTQINTQSQMNNIVQDYLSYRSTHCVTERLLSSSFFFLSLAFNLRLIISLFFPFLFFFTSSTGNSEVSAWYAVPEQHWIIVCRCT